VKSEALRLADALQVLVCACRCAKTAAHFSAAFNRRAVEVSGVAAVVQREGAGPGKYEIEEDEAEGDRRVAAVVDREEAARIVRHEIGDRHFAGQKERDRAGEQPERQKDAAGKFYERNFYI